LLNSTKEKNIQEIKNKLAKADGKAKDEKAAGHKTPTYTAVAHYRP
jgi:hypothetical protein